MNNELARRAVACKHWRWLPGMLTQHGRICGAGYLVSDDVDETGRPFVDCTDTTSEWPDLLPDLSDDLTRLGLLVLVREAWGDPLMYVAPGPGWYVGCGRVVGVAATGRTEAAALVAALEAAP